MEVLQIPGLRLPHAGRVLPLVTAEHRDQAPVALERRGRPNARPAPMPLFVPTHAFAATDGALSRRDIAAVS